MHTFLDIEARGVRQAERLLEGVGFRGTDARDAWPEVERILSKEVRRHFETRGGGSWEGTSDATEKRDRYGNRDPRLMFGSGHLFESLTKRGPGDGAVRDRDRTRLVYGTSVFYARWQDERRQLIPDLSRRALDRIADALERHITFADEATGELVRVR
jgi:hypothetical protein